MATEAGEAGGAAFEALLRRSAAFLDAQIESLIAEGVQPGALSAGRVGSAMRTLIGARRAAAPPDQDTRPHTIEGDHDGDGSEFGRLNGEEDEGEDDEDGGETDAALNARILRGLAHHKARRGLGIPVRPDGASGQESLRQPLERRAAPGPDTS